MPAGAEPAGDSGRRLTTPLAAAQQGRSDGGHPAAIAGRFRAAALVALVTAVLVLPPLGQRYVGTTDEARFLLYAREALAQRAFFEVRLRGKLFREKPPLYAWAIAALSLPEGRVTERTAHLPVALGAIGAAVFTFLLGDRLFNRRAGLWAGLVLATTFGFFRHSQIFLPEMLVLAFATAAAYWFWRSIEDPPGRGARVLLYVALALALYAKGPLGLLPWLVGALWLFGQRGPRGLTRLWSPSGLVLFMAITLTWVVPFLLLGTGTFAHTVIWQDWLLAYGSRPGSATLRGLGDAVGFFAPWSAVVLLVVWHAIRARHTPAVAYAGLSWVVPLVIVIMSAHFRTRYLLASTPGFALLVAWWADRHGSERTGLGRAIAWMALAGAAAAGALVFLPGLATLRSEYGIPEPGRALLPLVLASWGLALALWAGLERGRAGVLVGGVEGDAVALLTYGTWLHNARLGNTADIPQLAARLEAHARGGEAGVLFETGWLEVDYYLGRPLHEIRKARELEEYLARTGRPVLTNESTWRGIRDSVSPRIRVLERVTARGRTFLILGWSSDASSGSGFSPPHAGEPGSAGRRPGRGRGAQPAGSAGAAASST
jgi:4-amino-4-deoxy-L-arabinose transferase-like glycosyltransferase